MMPNKNISNSTHLAARMCRQPLRSAAQVWLRRHLWLACAATLTLCLAGCPMGQPADPLPEQDPIDNSAVKSLPATLPQEPEASPVPPVDIPPEHLAITSIEPTEGPVEGGLRVTIRGSGFVRGTTVSFGEARASNIAVLDSAVITVTTPAHAEGAVPVLIELPDGNVLEGEFVYRARVVCGDYDPTIDTDGDGLADGLEICRWPIAVDLYGFGTDDPSGLYYTFVSSDPDDPDTDDDGLSDYEEYLLGSDPRDQDTDHDGLNDAEEVYRWLTSPVSVDSDGDANGDNDALPPNASLFDGAELKIDFENDPTHTPAIDATSPIMADTDGDGRSDYEELGHPVLSPVIADLPALELKVVDDIDVMLNVEYAEEAGTSTEYGTSFSRATTESQNWYTGGTLQVSTGFSLMVGIEAEEGFPENSCKQKVEATMSTNISYSQQWQVGGEQSEELRNEYSEMETKSRTHTETISSGAISTGIVLTNTGPVSYHLTGLGMTVRLFERGVHPDDPLYVGSFKTVATLVPVLGENGFTLAPGQSSPVLQVQAENVNVDRIRDFMRDPHALHLEQAYFEMETESGLNYGFIEEATQASTATLTIDFADGEWHKYRLATNVNRDAWGNLTGVRMADVLDVLGIGFQTAMKYANPEHTIPICRVLTHVQKADGTWLPEEPDPNNIDRYAMWTVFGSNDDFDPNDTRDFEDVVLHAGDVAMLVFSVDADHDGVYGWDEDHYGSSDDPGNADYDGDGLTDDQEVNPQPLDPNDPNSPFVPAGWDVQVGDDPPYRAFSDPRLADGDGDGLNDLQEKLGRDGFPPGDPSDTGDATDPNKRDTDADGINDAADTWPLNPARILRVDDDSAGGDGSTWATAYSSLQTAIGVAQSANGDTNPVNDVTEIWVADGNYTFTVQQPLLPHVGYYGGFAGNETKRAQRTLSYGSVIDGAAHPEHRAFYTLNGATDAVLDGFQISNWSITGSWGGGAMDFFDSINVTLRNIWFLENSATWGGVIYMRDGDGNYDAGNILIHNCVFAGNESASDGGAIMGEYAAVEIRDCRFENNHATRWGGAVYASGADALLVSGSTFYQNQLTLTTTEFARGGAICAQIQGQFSLHECTFSGNAVTAASSYHAAGGAVWSDAEYTSVVNCLFLNNEVNSYTCSGDVWDGCGLLAQTSSSAGKAYVTNATFVGNLRSGANGAALMLAGPGLKQAVNVVSAHNGNDSQLQFTVTRFTSNEYVPSADPGVYTVRDICLFPRENFEGWDDYNIWSSNQNEVLTVDPDFVDYASGDVHLLETSPLIDVGYNFVDIDPGLAGIQFLPEYDLDGYLRIVDGDGDGVATVDIGAYEYSPQ